MQLESKTNLIVVIVSFVFGVTLFAITVIAGFIMEHYLFGVIGMAISILCILIGIIKLGKFKKKKLDYKFSIALSAIVFLLGAITIK